MDCVLPCDTCKSADVCITCGKGFYMNENTGNCVEADKCPIPFTFADDETRTCRHCFYTCYTCKGATSKDCILCNFALGFGRSAGDAGECFMLLCTEGMYLKIEPDQSRALCKSCDKTCRTCNGDGPHYCTECKPGLQVTKSNETEENVICKTCEMLNPGYYTDTDGTCKGIFRSKNEKKYVGMG